MCVPLRMPMEFVIPIHPEDLLISGNNFSINEGLDVESFSESSLKKSLGGM